MRKPWPLQSCSDRCCKPQARPATRRRPRAIWREAASAFAEVTSDTLGSSFARVPRRRGRDTLALVGHIDEIGVAVTNIEENGPALLHDRRRHLAGDADRPADRAPDARAASSPVRSRGSASRRSRSATGRAPSSPTCTSTSAPSRARRRRRSSASVTSRSGGAPVELPNGRARSRRALDNRLGAYIALEAARRIAEAKEAQVDVVAVAAVQEEIGLYGARVAAYGLEPQVALAIDVTPATDDPGGDPKRAGRIELGMGAMIARGPTMNKRGRRAARGGRRGGEDPACIRDLRADDVHRRRRAAPAARGDPDRACSRSRRATCTARTSCATSKTSSRSSG